MKKFATETKKLRSLADGLVKISLDGEMLLDGGRVHALVCVLKEIYAGVKLVRILRAYLSAVEKFVFATTLKIEHCGKISPHTIAEIKANFEKLRGRALSLCVEGDDSMIAGIRISLGDTVAEYSIAETLNAYIRRIRSEAVTSF
ncbi:MAG: F0F1 ATP synthase subunit delta [Puniceicoccales bacterium]|jgi:F0F1-type ATP synthase delta subunit|nr:F0F1 ATP synthase subunit delta [Puniceicoccales bacterium]